MRGPALRPTVIPLVTLLLSLAGMQPGVAREDPLRVAATVGMIGDIAAQVGGDCAEVTTVMGSGVDPHVYQASARDVRTFQRAELILYAGYSLEGQLGEVLAGFSRRKPTLAVAEAGVAEEALIATDDAYGVDPHLWMDAGLWRQTVPVIAQALAELRPDCAGLFRENGRHYAERLTALHDWVLEAIATIPANSRILVTAHDAFAYYGRAYGIEVAGIQGISTESEAGVADIRAMARVVAERRVPAVFIESTISPRTIQAVVAASGQLGHQVRIGAELYSDALGAAATPGGTYIGMIYENTVDIVLELGGALPALPSALEAWARDWNLPAGERVSGE